jgi:hypothetical protein
MSYGKNRSGPDQFSEIVAEAGVKRIYVGDSLNGLTDSLRRQGCCGNYALLVGSDISQIQDRRLSQQQSAPTLPTRSARCVRC